MTTPSFEADHNDGLRVQNRIPSFDHYDLYDSRFRRQNRQKRSERRDPFDLAISRKRGCFLRAGDIGEMIWLFGGTAEKYTFLQIGLSVSITRSVGRG